MIEKLPPSAGNMLGFRVSGTVSKDDYAVLAAEVGNLVKQHGQVSLLLDLEDFKREKASAWGADLKFGREYHQKIAKMALVGDKKWEEWLAKLAEPFYAREARFFHTEEREDAWAWLQEAA
jgi:hypothetical protein